MSVKQLILRAKIVYRTTTTNKVGARLRFLPPSVKYWFKASTKKTSMPMGSQNGWIDNLNNAPPLLN